MSKEGTYCHTPTSQAISPRQPACATPAASPCYTSSYFNLDGGYLGFDYGSGALYIDDVTVEYWNGTGWQTAVVEDFEIDSGSAQGKVIHDPAGNITYDGLHCYTYDPWNRLTGVKIAYTDTNGDLQPTATIATIVYDGLDRRISKAVTNSGDWDCTYHYYQDGDRVIETRNGSNQVLKCYRWGTQYQDELLTIDVNYDPYNSQTPSVHYAVLQDAHYNVVGLRGGDYYCRPNEDYEYTPYGERTVYKAVGSSGTPTAPILDSQGTLSSNTPWELCEFGHQGLMLDKEFGLYYVRARYLNPPLGRWNQPDHVGQFVDGANRFEAYRSNPVGRKRRREFLAAQR